MLQNTSSQKLVLKYFISIMVLLICTFNFSCKRLDIKSGIDVNRNQHFFTLKAVVSKSTKKLIDKLQLLNEQNGFVNTLADKEGTPVWDKVTIKKATTLARGLADSTEEYIIPLTVNEKSLSSLLEIKATPTNIIDIDNYTTNDYLNKKVHEPNADVQKMMELLTMFFYMENKTFGNIEFFNIPAKYFPQITKLDVNGNKTIVIKDVMPEQDYMITVCKTYLNVLCLICERLDCPETTYKEECTTYSGSFGNGGGGGFYTGPGIDPGATGGGNGGGGLGGGGSVNNPPYPDPPLPPCPHTGWYRGEPVAAIGSEPACDPIRPIITGDTTPIITLLNKYAVAIKRKSDSIYLLSNAIGSKNEWGLIFVKDIQHNIYPKNERTNNNPQYVKNNFNITVNETLLGEEHEHPDTDNQTNPLDRSAPTTEDVLALNKHRAINNYVAFVNCGNVKFAIVNENSAKANVFFDTYKIKSEELYYKQDSLAKIDPLHNTNWQQATLNALILIMGSANDCGLGVYKSSNADKTIFTKIN